MKTIQKLTGKINSAGFLFLFLGFMQPDFIPCQVRDTTIITVSPLTGIKRIEYCTFIGTGGGYAGEAPRLTKTIITKYDAKGNLIYLSKKTTRLRGCIRDEPNWTVMAYDSAGNKKILKLKRKRKVLITTYSLQGKKTSKEKIHIRDFSPPEWIDEETL
jgi:hypothetical protein